MLQGPLARIGPNDLVTNDPGIIRRMSAARSLYSKGQWYNATAISHEIDHIFSETDEREHTERRAKMAAGVRLPTLPYLGGVDQVVE